MFAVYAFPLRCSAAACSGRIRWQTHFGDTKLEAIGLFPGEHGQDNATLVLRGAAATPPCATGNKQGEGSAQDGAGRCSRAARCG